MNRLIQTGFGVLLTCLSPEKSKLWASQHLRTSLAPGLHQAWVNVRQLVPESTTPPTD